MINNIYIYGGSFDPVHNAHLEIMKYLSKEEDSLLILTIAKAPRWKTPTETIDDRLNMLKLSLKEKNIENYVIDDFELNSDKDVNYTIDTLKHIVDTYGKDKHYYLVIGGDQVNKFNEWKSAKEISELSTVLYIKRAHINLNKEIIKEYKMKRIPLTLPATNSTDVRECRDLDVPDCVLNYIFDNNLYFVKKIRSYIEERRYLHSVSVAKLCYEIAKSNHLKKPDRFFIAGLLHDIGKRVKEDEELEIMSKYYKKYLSLPKKAYHQFLGAFIAENDFQIKDKVILNAIKYHCSGNKNMSIMGMIVYAADKIDPLRGYDSKYMINPCMENAKEGFRFVLSENIKHLESQGKDYNNPLTLACIRCYLNK